MRDIPPLDTLGRRIIVLGPTNSGKSTLAEALSARLGIPAVYLDQLRHLPGTNWIKRDDDAFRRLHDEAIMADAWIVDGSYSALMPQRLARATGIIVLDDTLAVRTWRYLRRSVSPKRRAGGLEGTTDPVGLEMLRWLWRTRNKSDGVRQFARDSGLPYVFCRSEAELNRLYDEWGLEAFR